MPTLREQGYDVVAVPGIDNERLGALCRALGKAGSQYKQDWLQENPGPNIFEWDKSQENYMEKFDFASEQYRRKEGSALAVVPGIIITALSYAQWDHNGYARALAVFKEKDPKLFFEHYTYPDEPTYEPDTLPHAVAFDGFGETEEGLSVARLALDEVILRSHKIKGVPDPTSTLNTLPAALFEPYISTRVAAS